MAVTSKIVILWPWFDLRKWVFFWLPNLRVTWVWTKQHMISFMNLWTSCSATHTPLLLTFGQYIKPGYVDDFSYNLFNPVPLTVPSHFEFHFARSSVWRCEKRMGLNWDSMWKHWIARRLDPGHGDGPPEIRAMGGQPKWIFVKSSWFNKPLWMTCGDFDEVKKKQMQAKCRSIGIHMYLYNSIYIYI